jgi:hypothetical protein
MIHLFVDDQAVNSERLSESSKNRDLIAILLLFYELLDKYH